MGNVTYEDFFKSAKPQLMAHTEPDTIADAKANNIMWKLAKWFFKNPNKCNWTTTV